MVVVEKYPDLKANQNFLALQEELTSTENKISFSRRHTTTKYCSTTIKYSNSRPPSSPACSTSRKSRNSCRQPPQMSKDRHLKSVSNIINKV